MSRDNLISLVRQKLLNILNSVKKEESDIIGIEHSDGLDSNSILAGLVKGNNFNKNNIHTYSRKKINEMKGIIKLREFYGLNPKNCHFSSYDPEVNELKESIEILGFLPIIPHDTGSLKVFNKNNCNFILSGFGGDQCLSNSGKKIVNDLILNNKWQLAEEWIGGKKQLFKHLIKENYNLINEKFYFKNHDLLHNKYLTKVITDDGKILLNPFLKEKIEKISVS